MKTRILNTIIAAIAAVLPIGLSAQAEEKSATASSSVVTNADGTATVTIEVNGKKETKTFKLGEEGGIELELKDGGAIAKADAKGSEKLKQAPKTEKVTWLGVGIEPVRDEVRAQLPLHASEGLAVSHVMPDSPAAKAGIERLDIITRLNDQIIVSPDQFRALVKMHKPGEQLKVSLLRKGEKRDIEVTLAEHEEVIGKDKVFRWLGDGVMEFDLKAMPGADALRDRLKEMKEKYPGIIVDKQAWLLGPDGALKKFDGDKGLDKLIELTRKHLDESNLSKEVRESIRSAVEEAIRSAEKAARGAEKAAKAAADAAERVADAVEKAEKPAEVKPEDAPEKKL